MWLHIQSSCYPLPPTGFQDQDCERTAWEAEKGWLEDRASFPKVLGLNFSQGNVLCINYVALITGYEYYPLSFCKNLSLMSHSSVERTVEISREDEVRVAVTIMMYLCVLWFKFRYISVSCRGAWSMFSACTLI